MNERGGNVKFDIVTFMLYAIFSFFIVVLDDLTIPLHDDIKSNVLIVLNLMVLCVTFSMFLKPLNKRQFKKEWWISILGIIPIALIIVGTHLATFNYVYPERFSFMSDRRLKLYFLSGFIVYIILFSVIVKVYRLFFDKKQTVHGKIDNESMMKEE